MANRDDKTVKNAPQFVLDITGEVCPLTFVRTKLLVERMAAGETADVLLRGRSRRQRSSRSRASAIRCWRSFRWSIMGDGGGVHRLRFRKRGWTCQRTRSAIKASTVSPPRRR